MIKVSASIEANLFDALSYSLFAYRFAYLLSCVFISTVCNTCLKILIERRCGYKSCSVNVIDD